MNPSHAPVVATGREVQLLELASIGYTDKRIATELAITRATIAGYWRRIMLRNQASSRTELVARYSMGKRLTEDLSPQLQEEIDARAISQAADLEKENLLQSIKEVSSLYAAGNARYSEIFTRCLNELMSLTSSEYGFIGEVLMDAQGNPYLKTQALTDISWDKPTREFYDQNVDKGFEFRNLKTLFGEVITSQQPVIANEAPLDPRRGGIPPGHPALESFLGLPVMAGMDMIGMIGLANRPHGYEQEIIDFLSPMVATAACLIVGSRADSLRRNALAQLDEVLSISQPSWKRSTTALVVLNIDGNVQHLNEDFATIFRLKGAICDYIGHPWQELSASVQELFAETFSLHDPERSDGAAQQCFVMKDGRLVDREVLRPNPDGFVITLRVRRA